jgi:DnaJ domain
MDLRRARAVLGLESGSTLAQARRRYLQLAKQWHPDRHAGDPRLQSEALDYMRMVNAAYECIEAAAAPTAATSPSPARAPSARGSAPPGTRLSREEVERLVASIGTESWIDTAFGYPSRAVGWLAMRWPLRW